MQTNIFTARLIVKLRAEALLEKQQPVLFLVRENYGINM